MSVWKTDRAHGPLAGLRVLDFGRYIAGPVCAAFLADFGADVIRVEKPGGGEDRMLGSLTYDDDGAPREGPTFLQVNRNKRGLTLDSMTAAGREITARLIADADVVVANLPEAGLKAMGLDYATVSAINPRAILVTGSAFGSVGPYAERLGFDAIAQGMCGAAWLSGWPDQPVRQHAMWVDSATGMLLAFGTMVALRAREATGRGQVVEASLLRTALNVFNPPLIEQAVAKPDRVPHGNRAHVASPADICRCKDGWITVATSGDAMFRRWARLMGEEHWLSDPRFKTDISRGANGAVLSERTSQWCATRTVEEALAELAAAKVPAGPVLSLEGVLNDRHVREAQLLRPIDFPGLPQPAPIAASPVDLSETPPQPTERAPLTGEHSESIFRALGLSPSELATLRADGII